METFGGILLGVILGYLLEFSRPFVTALFMKGRLSIREKRIVSLVKEHKKIVGLKNEPLGVVYLLLLTIVILILFAIGGVAIVGQMLLEGVYGHPANIDFLYGVGNVVFILLIAASTFRAFLTLGMGFKVVEYNYYREETIAKIKKLGGNPEDLDKEETEKQGE
jgi:hypothetical protein